MIIPEAIILTVGKKMYGENGYRHWLKNFQDAMAKHEDGWVYYFRIHNPPKVDPDLIQFVHLTIGGKIRFRGYFGGVYYAPEGFMVFGDRQIDGYYWIIISGPIERPPKGMKFPRKGFQGFRYTHTLF